jgi:Protein of unknown function (DUF3348)
MVQAPKRATFSGPPFIRLLARLTDGDVHESRQSLADRLSQWIHWTDAIALSTALSGNPPAVPAGGRVFESAEAAECARVRTSLANAIVGDSGLAGGRRRGSVQAPLHEGPIETADTALGYSIFRQRYLSMQQTMETRIGDLRARLRIMLAARTPGMARLADVDAVMEQALFARERALLAAVPGLLGGHFERLCQAGQETGPGAPGPWLDVFRKDMQSLLLAELDLRFQPVEGLLAALRTR